ncbi:aryl hydrocarbon receptor-like isoform X2 [Tachysurus vachellii]|uniref:aryl hydrocarbon receptor-like isoform X2 n=1 Tax=Tachysurus vachellii TaxID=175792 RepID=UPI00296B12E0|nr:aryl hydrocarbon receptor-like isoform X2 [Tachysurus vachellii]
MPALCVKTAPDAAKSNPSKRHRDRLNGELDRLTNMLPFPENVCTRLDKLSVLRLSVGYLKVKSFFNATMRKNRSEFHAGNGLDGSKMDAKGFSEGDLLLQALNGFVLVVTAEGYVFYASPTILDYLGFHQSDVVHQSVFEFIHIDDRAMFRRQLHFALDPNLLDVEADGTQNSSDITKNIVTYDPQHIPPENSSFLERSFMCRFRCLLDNSSGFLKLNFQGRLKFLLGQNRKAEDGSLVQPQLALFAIATPVQPSAILEIRTKTLIFQTKHKLDFTPMGIDSRGKVVLGYTEMELCMRGSGYQFIHAADMMHCADNHVRMIKTGESGMTVFRLLTKNGGWVWVQANARLVYKGGRPDFIIARQRALVNAEGEEHLRQRTMQVPFNFTTGEAVLYDTGPTLDMMSPEDTNGVNQKTLAPSSILDSMQKQDKSIYHQDTKPQFTADDAFADSWALFNVPNHIMHDEPANEEDTIVSMIDTLEQLAHDGDLCTALQQMEVDTAELKEWENAILRLTKDDNGNDRPLSLNEILTNDIFSYVEDALYKENNTCSVLQTNATKTDPFAGHSGCEFAHHNFNSIGADKYDLKVDRKLNTIAGQQMDRMISTNATMDNNVPLYTEISSPNHMNNSFNSEQSGLFTCASKISQLMTEAEMHLGLKVTQSMYNVAPRNGWGPPRPTEKGRTSKLESTESFCQFASYPANNARNPQMNHSPNHIHKLSQTTPNLWNNMSTGDHNPSLSPSTKNHVSSTINYPNLSKFPQQIEIQAWQNPSPEQPCESLVKNRLAPEGCYQSLGSSGFPPADLQPESSQNCNDKHINFVNSVYQSPQNGLTLNECSPLSSCMFENHSPLNTNTDRQHPQAHTVTITSCGKATLPINQSPPQASCYFQWTCNEPLEGTASIPQQDTCISPQSCPTGPGFATLDSHSVFQRFLGCNGHI